MHTEIFVRLHIYSWKALQDLGLQDLPRFVNARGDRGVSPSFFRVGRSNSCGILSVWTSSYWNSMRRLSVVFADKAYKDIFCYTCFVVQGWAFSTVCGLSVSPLFEWRLVELRDLIPAVYSPLFVSCQFLFWLLFNHSPHLQRSITVIWNHILLEQAILGGLL